MAVAWYPDKYIRPIGISSAESFGRPVVTGNAIAGIGIASLEAFGVPTVIVGKLIKPIGIASLEAFGSLHVKYSQFIKPMGIASNETFGIVTVHAGTFRFTMQNLDINNNPIDYPAGDLFMQFDVGSLSAHPPADIPSIPNDKSLWGFTVVRDIASMTVPYTTWSRVPNGTTWELMFLASGSSYPSGCETIQTGSVESDLV